MKVPSRSSSIPIRRSKPRRPSNVLKKWTKTAVLQELKKLADPRIRAKRAHFGANVLNSYGISTPALHLLARRIGKDHNLASELWSSGIHEARILAALIGEPDKITAAHMERWAHDFDSWDAVDAVCCYLYAAATTAWDKVYDWSSRRGEFQKRAAFSLAAYLSYKDRAAGDERF